MKIKSLSEKSWRYIFVGLLFLCGTVITFQVMSNPTQEEVINEYTTPNSEDHYKIKNSNAKVTIINYFSLDCSHCRKMYELEEIFLKTNPEGLTNINIIYRHNPLEIQPLSQEKALMSECVYKQLGDEGFFAFIGNVYSTYTSTMHTGNDWVKKLAFEVIPSQKDFSSCLESDEAKNIVQKQKTENILQGINYTPTLIVFIDGKFVKKYDNIGGKTAIEIVKHYTNIASTK